MTKALVVGITGQDGYYSKPDWQLCRCLGISKAKSEFGFEEKTAFSRGLKKTIKWYLDIFAENAAEKCLN